MALLQLAIDLASTEEALSLASNCIQWIDIVEAGTPLIKNEGLKVVSALANHFPEKTILADMKIIDAGAMETKMAFEAGAQIVTVCASAPPPTLKAVIKTARDYEKKVMVDTVGVRDFPQILAEIQLLKPDYFGLHRGVDEAEAGRDLKPMLAQFLHSRAIPFSVAGRITLELIPEVMELRPAIVIVGGAIANSDNPEESARRLKQAILEFSHIPNSH